MTTTTAATPKPRRGNVYRSRDSRRHGLTVLVRHVRRKLGVAEVVNDIGQTYTIKLDRLNPRHHWAFMRHIPNTVDVDAVKYAPHF